MTHDETAASPEGYEDLARLHIAHLGMLSRQSPAKGQSVLLDADEVRAFLMCAKATGAVLFDLEERAIAQRIIDYWSADLLSSERSFVANSEMVTLEPFAQTIEDSFVAQGGPYAKLKEQPSFRSQWPGASSSARSASGDGPDQPPPVPPNPETQYIRIASIARQWRDINSHAYLLKGDALETALQFIRDPDIAQLVKASLNYKRRVKIQAILTVVLVSSALISLSYNAWVYVEKYTAAIVKENLSTILVGKDALRMAVDSRNFEVVARQRDLDVAISVLIQSLVSRRLSLNDIPKEIREKVLVELAFQVQSKAIEPSDLATDVAEALVQQMKTMNFKPFERELDGFQDGLPEPSNLTSVLPDLPDNLRAAAHAEGALVPYLHYSLVLDAQRRFALYAAANLDRVQRTVLPSRPVQFELDPRLPPDVQPDPKQYDEFVNAGRQIVQLVGRNDIAWGLEASNTAEVVDQMVQVYPNTVPVVPTVQVGWEAVSRWVQTNHNPSASRITILSGPVFTTSPSGGSMPVALWKIAVSVQDVQQQSAGPGALMVDAFLIEDSPGGKVSDPARHRSTVSEIARRTGLIFPPEMIARDAVDQGNTPLGPTHGDMLAAAVPGLDGSVAEKRKILVQQLLDFVRDDTRLAEDQAKVVSVLIDSLKNIDKMSATGRLNVIFVLSQVPRSSWDRLDWLQLRAGCRRVVATLESRERSGELHIGTETKRHLNRLKTNLGLNEQPSQTVYVEAADAWSDDAEYARVNLRMLGWKISDEKRDAKLSIVTTVFFNPDNAADAIAARMLVADLGQLLNLREYGYAADSEVVPGTLHLQILIF